MSDEDGVSKINGGTACGQAPPSEDEEQVQQRAVPRPLQHSTTRRARTQSGVGERARCGARQQLCAGGPGHGQTQWRRSMTNPGARHFPVPRRIRAAAPQPSNESACLPFPRTSSASFTPRARLSSSLHLTSRESIPSLTNPPSSPSSPYPSHSFWATAAATVTAKLHLLLTLLSPHLRDSCLIYTTGSHDRHTILHYPYLNYPSTDSLLPGRRHPLLSARQIEEKGTAAMQHLHGHGHGHMHNLRRRDAHIDVGSRASRTMADVASRVLAARADSSCTNDTDPGCTKPTQVPSLAIALAVMYV